MKANHRNIGFCTALLVSVLLLGGCAFGTRTVVLSYPPEAPEEGLIGAAQAAEAIATEPRDIALSVSDKRSESGRIGNVRNALGMDTADVVTRDDVAGWVEGALVSELTDAGYRVTRSGEAAPGNDVIGLEADILTVYCDVYLTYDGEVSLMVTLAGKDRAATSKQLVGKGSVGVNWAATAESYGESLALALQDAIAKLLTELAGY